MITQPVFSQLTDRPMAHCATLVELFDGDLLAAWFGGAYETAPDTAILAARYRVQTESWSQPWVMADWPDRPMGQPVFLQRPDGVLWLFYNVIMKWDWTSAQPYRQRSADGGKTWSEPEHLLDYPGLMFRSRPMVLDKRIILPVYDENVWQSHMMISDDDGASWRLTAPMKSPHGNIHPCVAPLDDGRLLAYMRTGGRGGSIWRSTSTDQGDTWSRLMATDLPNPNAGIDLLRLQSGALALAFNNNDRRRTPLCVAIGGQNEGFERMRTLEDERAEFSYPTLLQASDGRIHLVYTCRRRYIQHAVFSEEWLRNGTPRR